MTKIETILAFAQLHRGACLSGGFEGLTLWVEDSALHQRCTHCGEQLTVSLEHEEAETLRDLADAESPVFEDALRQAAWRNTQ